METTAKEGDLWNRPILGGQAPAEMSGEIGEVIYSETHNIPHNIPHKILLKRITFQDDLFT
jgi:hypothetical protein